MASIPSSTPLHLTTTAFRRPRPTKHSSSFSVKSSSDTNIPPPDTSSSSSAPIPADDGAFENRLSQVRLRYWSGTGTKAELRKAKKAGYSSSSSSSSSLYLPLIPLKEPKSFDGSKVEVGFSLYSEKINGRIAMLGLTALLLVELATGKGVINYHTPTIILIQVYFVAAVGAIWIKYEKECRRLAETLTPPTTYLHDVMRSCCY